MAKGPAPLRFIATWPGCLKMAKTSRRQFPGLPLTSGHHDGSRSATPARAKPGRTTCTAVVTNMHFHDMSGAYAILARAVFPRAIACKSVSQNSIHFAATTSFRSETWPHVKTRMETYLTPSRLTHSAQTDKSTLRDGTLRSTNSKSCPVQRRAAALKRGRAGAIASSVPTAGRPENRPSCSIRISRTSSKIADHRDGLELC